jgi:hypothetical protein
LNVTADVATAVIVPEVTGGRLGGSSADLDAVGPGCQNKGDTPP